MLAAALLKAKSQVSRGFLYPSFPSHFLEMFVQRHVFGALHCDSLYQGHGPFLLNNGLLSLHRNLLPPTSQICIV